MSKKFIDDTRQQILANSYTDEWSKNFQPMWGDWDTDERRYKKNSEKWKDVVENLNEQGRQEHATLTAEYARRETEINRLHPKRKASSEPLRH